MTLHPFGLRVAIVRSLVLLLIAVPVPMCRYSKLSDKELLQRLLHVCHAEGVAHTPDGLEAVVFTADGDMRQALNNLQVGMPWVGVAQGLHRAAALFPRVNRAAPLWCR